jgi:hypothetical protein
MIRVSVPTTFQQQVHQGILTVKELRAAGIPIVGVLWPEYVVQGTLTVTRADKETVYEWAPDPLLEQDEFCG